MGVSRSVGSSSSQKSYECIQPDYVENPADVFHLILASSLILVSCTSAMTLPNAPSMENRLLSLNSPIRAHVNVESRLGTFRCSVGNIGRSTVVGQ